MTKPPAGVPKEQRNYRIAKQLAEDFDDHCDRNDLVRDRTVERALRLFLDTVTKNNCRRFVVELSDEVSAALGAYRQVFMADRAELVEAALSQFIERRLDVDVEKREEYERVKFGALSRESN
jgi:metal-responsive CopG/Arc/MetJ family transcriptional regulator